MHQSGIAETRMSRIGSRLGLGCQVNFEFYPPLVVVLSVTYLVQSFWAQIARIVLILI